MSSGDLETQYQALCHGLALVDRTDRGLLVVTGADSVTWLHNLTTNHVKTLSHLDGNYAFAVSVQGRILFDLNILVRPDAIWIDLDRRFLERATQHFDKYIVMEDVTVEDRSDRFVRLAVIGDRAMSVLADLGASNVKAMSQLAQTDLMCQGVSVVAARHDFCGPYSVELFAAPDQAASVKGALVDGSGADVVGEEVVQIRRIEAGIPWPGYEITDEYLPAETLQLERAVSFNKGCYLGQEVVERMRSRDVVARQMVGLRFEGDRPPTKGAELATPDGQTVGQITSSCVSLAMGCPIGLGYVKTGSHEVGQGLSAQCGGVGVEAVVTSLPFV